MVRVNQFFKAPSTTTFVSNRCENSRQSFFPGLSARLSMPNTDFGKKMIRWVQAVTRELITMIKIVSLYPFSQTKHNPSRDEIERDLDGRAVQQPIILVHGYLHNSSGWAFHREQLNQNGFKNVFTFDLGALPNKSIDEYSQVLREKIKDVEELTGRNDVRLIGHSMGGLISSHYAVEYARKDGIQITEIITVNSPLHGTKVSVLGVGECCTEMAYRSEFIVTLGEKIRRATHIKFLHLASSNDALVMPYHSALNQGSPHESSSAEHLPHIKTQVYRKHGHLSVLFSQSVVADEIRFFS